MFLNSLSGRFLALTVVFIMLAEVLIFVPSVARFREDYLLLRLEKAQIASLALLADDMLDPALEAELLQSAGVYNVVLRRDDMRQLMLTSPVPQAITATYDLRNAGPYVLIRDALMQLLRPQNSVMRVMGEPLRDGGLLIEVTMDTGPLARAMLAYGINILLLSLVISSISAAALFVAVQIWMVGPIKRVVGAISAYSDAPEDARRIIQPSARLAELREAEGALQAMQVHLTGALRQKERLAQLGGAVAKISHDLRNILATAQLFADRMEVSDDPMVKRAAPKLVGSLSRAINLCETTLAFGKAEEPAPSLAVVDLDKLVRDVIETETMAMGDADVTFNVDIAPRTRITADPEQLFRVLSNLMRNARQALAATNRPGAIEVSFSQTEAEWRLAVTDNGPGLPMRARDHLFQPFQGGARKGGFGLGLAIAAELVRGHGGRLELNHTGDDGTGFVVTLPKRVSAAQKAVPRSENGARKSDPAQEASAIVETPAGRSEA